MNQQILCADRAQLIEMWIQAAREHASAVTRFNRRSEGLLSTRPPYLPIEQLRIKVEDAMRALDQHRKLHG
jgi:hypothetical protein